MTVLHPLRYALRQFRRAPVFTAAAGLTLALGIGGTTAIFSLIHAIVVRSLPVSDPARLYRVGDGDQCCVVGGPQGRWGLVSFPLYERLRSEAHEFEAITAFEARATRASVRRQGVDASARPMRSEYVTGSYFSTLGVDPFAGRVLTEDDDRSSAPPVAVLSHRTWRTAYGADGSVVGATFVVEGHPLTIVGIAPPGFFGETLSPSPPDLWIPIQQEPLINAANSMLRQPVSAWLRVIGRLKPGASADRMAARLTGVLRLWIERDSGYPSEWMGHVASVLPRQTLAVVPAGAGVGVMKEEYARSLQILLAVCALVLLVACANVANLMLARAATRRRQTAVRLAIGASRRQIVTQALTESVLLSLAGGVAGVGVAIGAVRLLLSLAFPDSAALPISAQPSPLVLLVAFALALVTGVAFGAAPAWYATRSDPVEALRHIGRGGGDRSSPARAALLVVQAAASVVLIAGATMLARSLGNLERQDFGYPVHGRVLVSVKRLPATYTLPRLTALYREVESRLGRLPGVKGWGLALYNPLTWNWSEAVFVSGHPPAQAGASYDRVSAGYLQTLGVPLRRGRYLSAADNENSQLVAVVNEAFVKRFFKSGEDPLDQHFGLGVPENAGTLRIVGIVGDAKFAGSGFNLPARPCFYVPLAQSVPYSQPFMAKTELRSHFVEGLMLVTDVSPRVSSRCSPRRSLQWIRT